MNCSFKASSQALPSHSLLSCWSDKQTVLRQCFKWQISVPFINRPVEMRKVSQAWRCPSLLHIHQLFNCSGYCCSWLTFRHWFQVWAYHDLSPPELLNYCPLCGHGTPALQSLIRLHVCTPLSFSTLTSPWSKPKWINHYPLLPLSVPRCVRPAGNIITPDIFWIIGRYCKVVLWLAMTCCACCVDSAKVNIAVSHRIVTDVSVCYHTCKSHSLHTKHKWLLAEWWYWSKTLYRLWMRPVLPTIIRACGEFLATFNPSS